MSSGLPCITSNHPCFRDISDESCRIGFEKVEEFDDVVVNILRNYEAFSERNFEKSKQFSYDKLLGEKVKFYGSWNEK